MESLVSHLKGLGIQRFDVDAGDYAAEGGTVCSRPDRAEALRRSHEAATHDKWFREQVEEAVQLADDPNTVWVSNEDAQKEWAEKRAKLAARIAVGNRA